MSYSILSQMILSSGSKLTRLKITPWMPLSGIILSQEPAAEPAHPRNVHLNIRTCAYVPFPNGKSNCCYSIRGLVWFSPNPLSNPKIPDQRTMNGFLRFCQTVYLNSLQIPDASDDERGKFPNGIRSWRKNPRSLMANQRESLAWFTLDELLYSLIIDFQQWA